MPLRFLNQHGTLPCLCWSEQLQVAQSHELSLMLWWLFYVSKHVGRDFVVGSLLRAACMHVVCGWPANKCVVYRCLPVLFASAMFRVSLVGGWAGSLASPAKLAWFTSMNQQADVLVALKVRNRRCHFVLRWVIGSTPNLSQPAVGAIGDKTRMPWYARHVRVQVFVFVPVTFEHASRQSAQWAIDFISGGHPAPQSDCMRLSC